MNFKDILQKLGTGSFWAFVVASIFLPLGLITVSEWFPITMTFVGAHTANNIISSVQQNQQKKKNDEQTTEEVPKP